MTWILEDEDGNSREIDDEDEAQDQKQSLEQLGATVELREVDDESKSEIDDKPQGDDDVDAEVIEMSGCGGNTDNDDEADSLPEPRDELGSYRGWMSFCKTCGRFSREIYRCQFDNCGKDLTNEPNYRGDLL